MIVATNISGAGFGLGTFEEGPVSGGCDAGKDFICGPKGGVFSCRPCDFPQLDAFKELQRMANQLVVALGMANKPGIIVGQHGCAGGDLLAIDGRIGPCTKKTITQIVRVFGPLTMAPTDPLLSLSKFQSEYEYIAHVAPELQAYFGQLVKLSNAPKNVPAPSRQPIKSVTAPGSVPVSSTPEEIRRVTRRVTRKTGRAGLVALGALAAIGLVGTGVYYYRTQA
jgi:hypothetical protein